MAQLKAGMTLLEMVGLAVGGVGAVATTGGGGGERRDPTPNFRYSADNPTQQTLYRRLGRAFFPDDHTYRSSNPLRINKNEARLVYTTYQRLQNMNNPATNRLLSELRRSQGIENIMLTNMGIQLPEKVDEGKKPDVDIEEKTRDLQRLADEVAESTDPAQRAELDNIKNAILDQLKEDLAKQQEDWDNAIAEQNAELAEDPTATNIWKAGLRQRRHLEELNAMGNAVVEDLARQGLPDVALDILDEIGENETLLEGVEDEMNDLVNVDLNLPQNRGRLDKLRKFIGDVGKGVPPLLAGGMMTIIGKQPPQPTGTGAGPVPKNIPPIPITPVVIGEVDLNLVKDETVADFKDPQYIDQHHHSPDEIENNQDMDEDDQYQVILSEFLLKGTEWDQRDETLFNESLNNEKMNLKSHITQSNDFTDTHVKDDTKDAGKYQNPRNDKDFYIRHSNIWKVGHALGNDKMEPDTNFGQMGMPVTKNDIKSVTKRVNRFINASNADLPDQTIDGEQKILSYDFRDNVSQTFTPQYEHRGFESEQVSANHKLKETYQSVYSDLRNPQYRQKKRLF